MGLVRNTTLGNSNARLSIGSVVEEVKEDEMCNKNMNMWK
jgi:hypothetical protein